MKLKTYLLASVFMAGLAIPRAEAIVPKPPIGHPIIYPESYLLLLLLLGSPVFDPSMLAYNQILDLDLPEGDEGNEERDWQVRSKQRKTKRDLNRLTKRPKNYDKQRSRYPGR